MAVKTKKTFPNAVGANGQSSTVFTPVEVQLNNQDDLDVYVTLSGGTRVLQLRQSTGSTAIGSGVNKHPQVNDTTGLYFPAVTAGTTLYNYTLSTDNNTITFSTALPSGAVVSIERRTRDADSNYTTFASGSTIRATDLNNSSTESNFTAQEARNKAFELEGKIFGGEATSTSFISSDEIVDGTIVNADINDNAEIAVSKLANGSARQILQTAANGTDVEFTSNVDIPGTLDVTGNADIDSNLNVDGTLTVASAVDFNNDLDVDGNTNLDNTTIDGYINVTGVATVDNVRIDANTIRAHSGNLNIDSQGGTVTVDDNLTVTGNLTTNGTFNNLTTTEIAILDGATVSTAELNILDGVTATTAELNYVDGVTSNVQTQLDAKQPLDAELTELATMTSGTASALADLTQTEVQTIDGITATTAELNLNDGQTATPAEVNILDGATVTTNELNILDGVTATKDEINLLDGKSVVTTITGSATDTQLPSAQAVNERIVELVTEVGGFHPIANETSFPSTNPDINDGAGTIVSLKSLSSAFSTGSGVTTKVFTNGAGSGVNVTVNGLPASTTFQAGKGLLLETTSTLHTYNYHRLVLDESGVSNADALVTNFNEKYYGPLSSNPATRPSGANRQNGDLYFNTSDGKMKVYNGSHASGTWDDVAAPGNFFINTLSSSSGSGGGSATFNGTATRFTLSNPPLTAQQLLVSVNGVIQKPNSGTSPSEGFAIDGADIIFASAPATNAPHFIVTIGSSVNIGTPSDATVTSAKIVDGTIVNGDISSSAAIAKSKLAALDIVNADVNASAAIAGTKISPNFGSADVVTTGNLDLSDSSGAGNNRIRLGDSDDFSLFHDGSDNKVIAANGGLLVQSNHYSLRNENGSATYATIDSSANVGIGTTTPLSGAKLTVASQGLAITGQNLAHSANSLRLGEEGSGLAQFRAYGSDASNAGSFQFTTSASDGTGGSTNALRIAADGKVGLGTTSPSEVLTIGDGDLKFYHSNAANSHRTTFIEFGNSSNRITSETNYGSDSSSNYTAGLKFTTKNFNGSSFVTVDALNIQANGRVGIGTTSPSQKLTVAYSNGSPWSTSSLGVGMKVENTNAVNGVASGIELRSFQNNGGASIQYIHAVNDGVSSYGSDLVFSTRVAYTGAYRESCRITNAGSLKFPNGHGIDFSDTANSSGTMANELFDDYEEGTWTPAYLSSNGTYGYTTQTGHYTKVGNVVTVSAYIRTSSVSATAHNLVKVTGLPFAEAKGQRTPGSVRCNGFQGTLTNMDYPSTWSVEASSSHGELQKFADGGNNDYTSSTMNNATFVYLQCTYTAA